MTNVIKEIFNSNIGKKCKIVINNDFVYYAFIKEVDDFFVVVVLDRSTNIKVINLDEIKEVLIFNDIQ